MIKEKKYRKERLGDVSCKQEECQPARCLLRSAAQAHTATWGGGGGGGGGGGKQQYKTPAIFGRTSALVGRHWIGKDMTKIWLRPLKYRAVLLHWEGHMKSGPNGPLKEFTIKDLSMFTSTFCSFVRKETSPFKCSTSKCPFMSIYVAKSPPELNKIC